MSAKARALKLLYNRHRIDKAGIDKAFADGIITEAEYHWILGE